MQSKTGKKKAFASKAMDKKAEYLPALSCLSLIFIIMKPLKNGNRRKTPVASGHEGVLAAACVHELDSKRPSCRSLD